MQLTDYQPNFNDPRVKSRVETVLGWCNLTLNGRPTQVHHNTLISVFGPSGNKLAAYLRANLLIRTGVYTPGSQSYSYILNQRGAEKLTTLISADGQLTPNRYIKEKFGMELQTLEFNYTLKSDRYWHPLQNIRRSLKDQFWTEHGLPYDYDIEACAPTILIGLATKLGFLDILAEPIKDYINNKERYRAYIADLLEISYDDAKRLLNSLFNGAKIAANPFNSTYHLLDGDVIKISRLQNDHRVKVLRGAIKRMWHHIGRHINKKVTTSSKEKWNLYFRWERLVLDHIKAHLAANGYKVFTEHDGFRTDRAIYTKKLEDEIEVLLGFRLTIKLKNEPEKKIENGNYIVAEVIEL